MKANELRIGNIVNCEYYNPNPNNIGFELEPSMITLIREKTCNFKIKGGSKFDTNIENGSIKPISLTENLLIKTGFKPIEVGGFGGWFENGIIRILHEKGYFIVEAFSMNKYVWLVNIKFLHHLQNLCFDLDIELSNSYSWF
jgi:hypothetical protein